MRACRRLLVCVCVPQSKRVATIPYAHDMNKTHHKKRYNAHNNERVCKALHIGKPLSLNAEQQQQSASPGLAADLVWGLNKINTSRATLRVIYARHARANTHICIHTSAYYAQQAQKWRKRAECNMCVCVMRLSDCDTIARICQYFLLALSLPL